ncbi:MAG: hypothetical protein R2711_11880 [Acidimicrobiales bacterium]
MVTDPGRARRAWPASGASATPSNPSDIGGRYSALSYFGLAPAALAGLDWGALIQGAGVPVAAPQRPDRQPRALPGAVEAAVKAGRDKVTLVLDPRIEAFGLWLEQLLAESTGKAGTGTVQWPASRSARS